MPVFPSSSQFVLRTLAPNSFFKGSATSLDFDGATAAGPSFVIEPRRFPLAAQPDMMRAAEKDHQYASFVYETCHDAFHHVFSNRVVVAYQNETKLLVLMMY